MSGLVEECYEKAVEVIRGNVTKYGLKASRAYYNQVWARDSFITFLGANLLQDPILIQACINTLRTLAKHQSPMGQIPNHFDLEKMRPDFGSSGATDATAWFVIGVAQLYNVTKDSSLLRKFLKPALKAFRWLRYQDANNTLLIDSPEGADWMDAAIQRTGKTLYNNVLFFEAARSIQHLSREARISLRGQDDMDLEELKGRIREVFWPTPKAIQRIASYWPWYSTYLERAPAFTSPGAIGHFLHFISFARVDRHLDSLSNFLAIILGIATGEQMARIVDYVERERVAEPYPIKVLHPPYTRGDPSFKEDLNRWLPVQHRSDPYMYHNGGIWPFVGGFYVLALNRVDKAKAAESLEKLAQVNKIGKGTIREWGFLEWLNGKIAKPLGQVHQSWSAGMYVAAYLAVKEKRPLHLA